MVTIILCSSYYYLFKSNKFCPFSSHSLAVGARARVRDLEEAPYTVVAQHEGWEEREYPPTRWVSTQAFDIFPHDGMEHYKVRFHRVDQNADFICWFTIAYRKRQESVTDRKSCWNLSNRNQFASSSTPTVRSYCGIMNTCKQSYNFVGLLSSWTPFQSLFLSAMFSLCQRP